MVNYPLNLRPAKNRDAQSPGPGKFFLDLSLRSENNHIMDRRNFLQTTAAFASASLIGGTVRATQPAEPAPPTEPFGFAAASVLLNPTPNSVTVLALPNALATGWVEYGPTEALGQRAGGNSRGQCPLSDNLLSFSIIGLQPGERCLYRVCLKPLIYKSVYSVKPGDEIRSEICSFRTLNPAADHASFTIWNDTHETIPTVTKLSQNLNASPTDFLFWNGDVTNDIQHESKIIPNYLAPALQPFAATIPFMMTRGNHDVRGRDARTLTRYLTGPNGEYFYAFRHGPVAAIVLDTGEDKPDDQLEYGGLNDFAAYRSLQRSFLEEAIAAPAFASAPFRIILLHIPFFWDAEVPAHWLTVWGKDSKGKINNGWICEDGYAKWHDLFVKARVDVIISGHTHKHAFFPANDKHPYAQLIGGGPAADVALSIIATATREQLTFTLNDLDGKMVMQQTFKPQG
jgi:predicted phosphodiesterase